MAILGRIRARGILLLVVVGLAMLAFIIGDFLNSGATWFHAMNNNVAKVNGEKVDAIEYSQAIEQLTDVYKIEYNRSDINEEMMEQIRAQVWETTIDQMLLEKEAAKLGISISAEELSEHIIGDKTHPFIQQRRAFADENGRFSKQSLINFIASIEQGDDANPQVQQAKSYYMFWENMVRYDLLQQKYNTLIAKACTANSLDAKAVFNANAQNTDVAFALYPYALIPDSTLNVAKDETKAYYKQHRKDFKQQPYRSVAYVRYEKQPSEEDYKDVQNFINGLKAEFDTTQSVAELVTYNSDVPYRGVNYSESTIPADLKDFAFNGKVGDVTPVTLVGDIYRTARIMETGIMTPDSVKLAHIYLAEVDSVRADSIMNAVRRGADWGELVKHYSIDTQSAANQGEIGWFEENSLDKEIADPAFSLPEKQMFLFNNGQGLQILRVQERTPLRRKVKVAILERQVTPSSHTIADIYNTAKQLAGASKDYEQLKQEAEKAGKTVMPAVDVQQGSERLANLKQSRQIVRWAFQAKEGDVSDVFECDDIIVVAALEKASDDEYRSLEEATDEINSKLLNDKKADKIAAEIAGKSLEEVAAIANTEIDSVQNVNATSPYFGSAGMEPAATATAAALAEGQLSAPVKGNRGVFVIQGVKVNPQERGEFDAKREILSLNMRNIYSLPQLIGANLRNKAKIEDQRLKLY